MFSCPHLIGVLILRHVFSVVWFPTMSDGQGKKGGSQGAELFGVVSTRGNRGFMPRYPRPNRPATVRKTVPNRRLSAGIFFNDFKSPETMSVRLDHFLDS